MGKKPIKGLESQMEQGVSRETRGNSKPTTTVNVGRGRGKGKGVRVEKDFTKKGFNDPSWYAHNKQLLVDAASLAFANFQGMEISNTGSGVGGKVFKPAGTCALMYIPTFGKASSAVDPLNIAVRNIYSFVRHANAGHTNYEPADLGLYLFGVVEIYGIIAELERIYGVSRVYSVKNRNMPKQLLGAMLCDADDILTNQATFRFNINRLIQKVSSLCIPKGFSLLERRVWMNSYVFKDADTDKASQYVFVPYGQYKYEPTKLSTGGILEFNLNTQLQRTVNVLINNAESVIDAILQDEDMNIMSGDILKAYGSSGLASMNYLPEDYTVVPVYQPEVLPQIHNADLLSTWDGDMPTSKRYNVGTVDYSACGALFIQQKDGILMNEINMSDGQYWTDPDGNGVPTDGTHAATKTFKWSVGKKLLDLPTDSATPEDVMVATRLKVGLYIWSTLQASPRYVVNLKEFGTEIVVGAYTYEAKEDYVGNAVLIPSNNIYPTVSGAAPIVPDYLRYIRAFAQFDMFPICYITDQDNAAGSASVDIGDWYWKYILGDIYNFTSITDNELHKLHSTAVLSELTLPNSLFADK